MAKEMRTIWTCDRCGAVVETSNAPIMPQPPPFEGAPTPPMPVPPMGQSAVIPQGWREFQQMPLNGQWRQTILCYDCCEDLVGWMQQGSPYAPPGPDQEAAR